MSKTFYNCKGFSLTQFWGGEKDKLSVQITDDECNCCCLNTSEARRLIKRLNKWLEQQK